tara:strand:+ start:254 stop:424 length:171 start_codon:yes stop_codon:yes gene_type:complete
VSPPADYLKPQPHEKKHGTRFQTAINVRHINEEAIAQKSVMIASFQSQRQPFSVNK